MSIEAAALGTLTRDADHRTGQSGKPFTLLNLVSGDGDSRQFLSAIVFGDAAAKVAKLEKGSRVYLEGKVEVSDWTDRDGNKKVGLKIAAFYAHVPGIGRNKPPRQKKEKDRPHESWASPKAPPPAFSDDF